MSLDVYLFLEDKNKPAYRGGIFIRRAGEIKEITLTEWRERYPGHAFTWVDIADSDEAGKIEVYSGNITHNLGRMAAEAGIYEALWRPEEKQYTKAEQLIEPLEKGLEKLRSNPDYFKLSTPQMAGVTMRV